MLGLNDDMILGEYKKKLNKSIDAVTGTPDSSRAMPLGDYVAFWEALSKPTNATNFLHELIETLMVVEKKAVKNKEIKGKSKIFGKSTLEPHRHIVIDIIICGLCAIWLSTLHSYKSNF
jgi:hypothetical protein